MDILRKFINLKLVKPRDLTLTEFSECYLEDLKSHDVYSLLLELINGFYSDRVMRIKP